jgi:hypothetical protein
LPARLVGDGEPLDLPYVRVAGELGGRAQPDVADDPAVEFGDQMIVGRVPSVEEGAVRRLRAAA